MENNIPQSVVVHNDNEFYITVMKLKKPINIKPMDEKDGKEITLSEMECRCLITPPGVSNQCQCCEEKILPEYPFIIEEKVE